jgi:hypothetical protein
VKKDEVRLEMRAETKTGDEGRTMLKQLPFQNPALSVTAKLKHDELKTCERVEMGTNDERAIMRGGASTTTDHSK